MRKIEGVVVYYDDGSRERLSAQQIMERFFAGFGGFVNSPSQNTSGVSQESEPLVTEPEKNIQTSSKSTFATPETEVSNAPILGVEETVASGPKEVSKNQSLQYATIDDKEYRAATCTRFPFGGEELRGKSMCNVG